MSNDPITGITVQVLDNETSEPLANADVMAKKRAGTDMIKSVKRTEIDGFAIITTLEPTVYDCQVVLDSYITEPGSFTITSGIMKNLTVRMHKS
jgi:hypothetical protein